MDRRVPPAEAVSEGARRATGETASGAPHRDPEVFAVGRRRQFSGSEKRRSWPRPTGARRPVRSGRSCARSTSTPRCCELAQAAWRGRPGGARAEAARTKAGRLSPPDPAAHARQCAAAPQARARRVDHRRPKKTMCGTGAADGGRSDRGGVMLAVTELAPHIGMRSACRGLRAEPRVRVPRSRPPSRGQPTVRAAARPRPPLALSMRRAGDPARCARQRALRGRGAGSVFATLLDEGRYHGSIRTMYRLLAAQDQSGERRQSANPSDSTPSPNCWRSGPTKCGPGTSPN